MNESTKLLYMEGSYRQECKAAVKSVKEKNGGAEIILTETIFYPRGGGQPCDQGVIKGVSGELKVTNVTYNNGNPIHQGKLKGSLKEGDKVNCVIDWNRRYRNMRVHSAGHLVHEVVHEAAPDLKPIRGQHGIGGEQFIEYEGMATLDRIGLNMRLAQVINEKRAVKTYFVTFEELKKKAQFVPVNLPKNKPLRVMEIEGFGPVPDGGTQVRSSEELEGTSITDIETAGGTIKVHYQSRMETPLPAIKVKKTAGKKIEEFRSDTATILSQENYLSIKNNALALITGANSGEELSGLRVKYLGRKGEINRMLAEIPKMAAAEKTRAGEMINDLKRVIEEAISAKGGEILETEDSGWVDLTAPGIRPPEGHLHLVTQAVMEITRIFEKIGFTRVRHPEVDWDWYAFESLNMPPNHPARDEWETFFIATNNKQQTTNNKKFQSIVLTPHTSNGQVREMERGRLPIRMINIAKCYRRQSDVSHVPMLHQFEGLYIDKNVSIGDLKGVIDYFFKQYYGPERKSRLRPFHFQFTEPSFEVDINCGVCLGHGCKFCKEGWVELAGAGMVHPTVIKNGGLDPNIYNGFAFGWGIERVAMMKSGTKLDDIRLLYGNDVRFLEQF